MTLTIVLAVMTGFEEDLRDRILGFNPHVSVWGQLGRSATTTGRQHGARRARGRRAGRSSTAS